MNRKEFEWTDELAADFAVNFGHYCGSASDMLSEFKKANAKKAEQVEFPDGVLEVSYNGKFFSTERSSDLEYQSVLDTFLNKHPKWQIKTVKNSFGQIFTIGDCTNHGQIKRFYLTSYGIAAETYESKVGWLIKDLIRIQEKQKMKKMYPEGVIEVANTGLAKADMIGYRGDNYQNRLDIFLGKEPKWRISKVKNSFGCILNIGDYTNRGKIVSFGIHNEKILATVVSRFTP